MRSARRGDLRQAPPGARCYAGRVAALNPSSISQVLVRATNWLGDAVMSLPAIRAIRERLSARPSRGGRAALGGRPVRPRERHRPRDPVCRRARSGRQARLRRLPARGALRWRHPAAERLRCRADGLAGGHSGAHRLQPRRPRPAAHARHRRARAGRNPAPRALLLSGTAAARRHDRAISAHARPFAWRASRRRARRARGTSRRWGWPGR